MTDSLPRLFLTAAILALAWQNLSAWGPNGHSVTGTLALRLADDRARTELEGILDSTDEEAIGSLCNWPDLIRENPDWAWTEPQHYVNIPRSSDSYSKQRDCRGNLCVTEAIKSYAAQLADGRLTIQRRRRAFAWLCHLVADIHQPLHCGFADDRGGNTIAVKYGGEMTDLHEFWDGALIRSRVSSRNELNEALEPYLQSPRRSSWPPHSVDEWTNESHRLAVQSAYPENTRISEAFAEASWPLAKQQLARSAERLALVLNAVLGDGAVELTTEEQR